jgi:hypothetical protein
MFSTLGKQACHLLRAGKPNPELIRRISIMFRSLPRMLGLSILVLGVASLLLTNSATGQFGWINANHVPKDKPAKFFPPIFDKGFRPGFGKAPAIQSPAPRPPVSNFLGNNQGIAGNQGNQGNNGGFTGNNGGFGGGLGGQFQGGFGGGGQFQGGFGGGGQFQGGFGGQGGIQGLSGQSIISFGGFSGSLQFPPQIGAGNYLGMQGGIFGLTGGQMQGQFQGFQGGFQGLGGGGFQGLGGGGFQGLGGGFQGGFGGGFQGGFGGNIGGGLGGNGGFKGFGLSGGYGI